MVSVDDLQSTRQVMMCIRQTLLNMSKRYASLDIPGVASSRNSLKH